MTGCNLDWFIQYTRKQGSEPIACQAEIHFYFFRGNISSSDFILSFCLQIIFLSTNIKNVFMHENCLNEILRKIMKKNSF